MNTNLIDWIRATISLLNISNYKSWIKELYIYKNHMIKFLSTAKGKARVNICSAHWTKRWFVKWCLDWTGWHCWLLGHYLPFSTNPPQWLSTFPCLIGLSCSFIACAQLQGSCFSITWTNNNHNSFKPYIMFLS